VTFVTSTLISWAATAWKVGGTGDSKVSRDPGTSDDLPDIWERRFFGNLDQTNSGDPDGDSQSNLTEYGNGSDPTHNNTIPNIGNAVENNLLTWTSGGNANWAHSTSDWLVGGDSAKSGAIGHDQISWMETEVMGPGWISFYWRVSADFGDYFQFTHYHPAGGGTGLWRDGISSWAYHSRNLHPGTNRFRFEYVKDSSGSSGTDAAFVDNFQVTYGGSSINWAEPLANAVDVHVPRGSLHTSLGQF
jgi:hypothetical protein